MAQKTGANAWIAHPRRDLPPSRNIIGEVRGFEVLGFEGYTAEGFKVFRVQGC